MLLNDVAEAMNANIERQQNIQNPSTFRQHFQSAQPQAYFLNFVAVVMSVDHSEVVFRKEEESELEVVADLFKVQETVNIVANPEQFIKHCRLLQREEGSTGRISKLHNNYTTTQKPKIISPFNKVIFFGNSSLT